MTTSHAEIEDKYTVPDGAVLPDLGALPEVASVADPVLHELEATYFDTADLALIAVGITLRRRTGGEDEGWHLKLPRDAGRFEVHVPLARARSTVPRELADILAATVRGADLSPVATVATSRTAHRLVDAEGRLLAEVADDLVTTQALRVDQGAASLRSWREWEFELVDGDRALLESAARLFEAAGAVASTSGSKLARALDGQVPAPRVRAVPSQRAAAPADIVLAWLCEQVQELRRQDPLVRADAPDGVHQMRVATRRLRSAFATFRPLLDRDVTDPVRDELKWIAGVLGEARDAEVLHERLSVMLLDEPPLDEQPFDGGGAAGTRVDRTLGDRYARAHARCVRAMSSERYFALLDRLDEVLAEPPWLDDAGDGAPDVLARRVLHDWKRLERRVRDVHETDDEDARHRRIHEVRKAAKRVRYAAEPLVPLYGKPAERFVRDVERIQTVLGEHQDSIVAQHELRGLADASGDVGAEAFTFGVLHAREDLNQQATETLVWKAWAKASKKKRRKWLT